MEYTKNYKLQVKKVKIITGVTADAVEKAAADFQKEHEVFEIIQKSEKLMIMFYWGDENEGRDN